MIAMSELSAVIKLMRLKMIFISGITYATGASMGMRSTAGSTAFTAHDITSLSCIPLMHYSVYLIIYCGVRK